MHQAITTTKIEKIPQAAAKIQRKSIVVKRALLL